MTNETVSIPKKEYLKLKMSKRLDDKLLEQLIKSLEDIKAGRIKRVC